MKKLLLILLCLPIIGFGQNKKELKRLIVIKNDSIKTLKSSINKTQLDYNILESLLDSTINIASAISIERDKINRQLDSIIVLINSKDNIDTVLVCALDLKLYKDTITEDRWGYKYNTEKKIMFYNCEPFTGVAINLHNNGKLKEVLNYNFGQITDLKEWYVSGELYKEGKYQIGTEFTHVPTGYWNIWHKNGLLASSEFHYVNGGTGGHIFTLPCRADYCNPSYGIINSDGTVDTVNSDDCCMRCWDKYGKRIDCK
tara:strand:+ start:174 stop:944 length:771 start_codon:yes stop_codon:yes gene_type:complete